MQKKGKQVASTTKWGLGEHIVLRLVECLSPTASFDIFMDNYFTSFHLFTHLGVNNIQPDVLNKNRLHKCTIIWDKELQKKRNSATLNSAADIKQKSSVTCVVSSNDTRAIYIASSESCQPSRDLLGVGTKSKESVFKNNNQISHLFEISYQMFVMMVLLRCLRLMKYGKTSC